MTRTTLTLLVLRQNESDWVNYGTLYPRGGKRTRGFFANDVIAAVHVGVNASSARRFDSPALFSYRC